MALVCNLQSTIMLQQFFNQRFIFIAALTCITIFFSCKDEYTLCEESRFVSLNGNFYKAGVVPDQLRPISYSITTFNGTPVLTNVPNSAAFSFQLPANADSARYIFNLAGAPVDTITLRYSTQNEMLSVQCGEITTNTLTSAKTTHHTIDTIIINSPAVATRLAQNIKVYF